MKKYFRNLEAILFVKGEVNTDLKEIMAFFSIDKRQAEKLIDEYKEFLDNNANSALTLKIFNDKLKITTKPSLDKDITKYLQRNRKTNIDLSSSLIEVLTIIAYSQPITRVEIDYIRGVDSVSGINKLILFDLVEIQGRSSNLGRPYLYGTTNFFLEHFNKKNIKELPEFKKKITAKLKELNS